jgi:hypothetical protein
MLCSTQYGVLARNWASDIRDTQQRRTPFAMDSHSICDQAWEILFNRGSHAARARSLVHATRVKSGITNGSRFTAVIEDYDEARELS